MLVDLSRFSTNQPAFSIMPVSTLTLNNGLKLPQIGLGTWQARDEPEAVGQAVKDAIDAGYRHFDCAMAYENEHVVGKAIREKIAEGVVTREELFIVTKLWNNRHRESIVVPTCKQSCENFGLDYVDLYLMHWPVAIGEHVEGLFPENLAEKVVDIPIEATWKGLESCYRLGLAKSIGLSNFNASQIDRILAIAEVKPVVNQIECHPNLQQKKLRDFCNARNIIVTAYSPFGSPQRNWAKPGDPQVVIEHPDIVAIGKKYNKTAAQVVLRFLVDNGIAAIPKSSSKERIRQNIDIFDFKLTAQEKAVFDQFDIGLRIIPALELQGSKEYPFHAEF